MTLMTSVLRVHNLLDLPQELLGDILSFSSPRDIARFGQTCHKAHSFVSPSNQLLWRCAFLQEYDDPFERWTTLLPSARKENAPREEKWDWFVELHRRLMAFRVANQSSSPSVQPDFEDAIETILDIIETAKVNPSKPGSVQGEDSRNLRHLRPQGANLGPIEDLIHDYHLLSRLQEQDPYSTDVSISSRHFTRSLARLHMSKRSDAVSRLHVFIGLTSSETMGGKGKAAARRLVYDWHLTGSRSDYGPYILNDSGNVNWQLLEAICSVIGRNVNKCVHGHMSMPQGLPYSLPFQTGVDPTAPEDWAGVSGIWYGTYSFLDYAALFHYNVGYQPEPRPNLEDEPEACGDLMRLELRLDDKVRTDWRLESQLPISLDLPPLYFSGTSRGHGGPQRPLISVRGRVSLTPGAREVRWRFFISYGGADQWQLEGVQPGGVRSGGVYGLWSHCDHEDHGPVGPFCYFPSVLCNYLH